jgi:hypothetical protein
VVLTTSPAGFQMGDGPSPAPAPGRNDQLHGAEDEQPENDDGGDDDPGRLDADAAGDMRAVLIVTWPAPPGDERVPEVGPDEEHDGRGQQRHESDVELLVVRGGGHAAGLHVRVPGEPDDQVRGDGKNQPDQEDPQAVARFRRGR